MKIHIIGDSGRGKMYNEMDMVEIKKLFEPYKDNVIMIK